MRPSLVLTLNQGRTLHTRWQDLAFTAALRTDDPLLEQAAPALEWLEETDRREARDSSYQDGVAALESALHRQRPREVLEHLYESLARLGEPLPPDLQTRYERRLVELDRTALA